MNFKHIVCKFFLFLYVVQAALFAGPTQRHLALHSIEEIIEELDFDEDLVKKIPLFLEIANHETEDTFFGYHGMSQNNRLFQDILNSLFEEVLNIPIPKNFYFMRIPEESAWNWKEGKD